ncbi:MAG: hypothetical protein LW818_08955 [Ignavibacteriae bacterium]|jgi:hypothetical protein|nr:hypothetical protein [Ignavibacteriota bacterium]
MSRFWVKIEGCDVDTFSTGNATYTAIQIPILGMFPSFDIESGSDVSMQGREIGQRKIRRALELVCFPNSTWMDNPTTYLNTDSIMFLLDSVLQRKFVRLNAPDAPKVLPDRYRDSTNFPRTSALIPFVFVRCEIANEKAWASGNEKLTLTCYSRDLASRV